MCERLGVHFQNVPSLLQLAYAQHGMGVAEGAVWVPAKLGRSWKKLDPEIQALVRAEDEAALRLLPEGVD